MRVFRHALSLDEVSAYKHSVRSIADLFSKRRVRFQPNMYERVTPQCAVHNTAPGSGKPAAPCDALEVWFAGCHSDVGGSAVLNTEKFSLADISLEWMVQQVILSNCGIKFDDTALAEAGIIVPGPTTPQKGRRWETMDDARRLDVKASVNDKLKSNPAWWISEFFPVRFMWQDPDGEWKSKWRYVSVKLRALVRL